jgi:Ion channel
MDVVLTVTGIAMILYGLMDMFHTLLHPSGQGRLSVLVLSAAWRLSKILGHRLGSAIGPAAMVAVIVLWVAVQGIDWALIYYPHIPGGFVYSSGVDPADYPDFHEALYISLVTLSTLGYGDVVATDAWIRIASPLEALVGFALLTAALTWFTQIYPPQKTRFRRSCLLRLEEGRSLSDCPAGTVVCPILPPRPLLRKRQPRSGTVLPQPSLNHSFVGAADSVRRPVLCQQGPDQFLCMCEFRSSERS